MRSPLRALGLFAIVALGSERAIAAPTVTQWFEAYSPITMEPSVERTAADAAKLVRWLEVETTGNVRSVTFRPDGRVKWKLTYGAHGLDEKVTTVDGVQVSRSVFGRDPAGHLATKTVTLAGGGKLEDVYTIDAKGRVVERARKGGGEVFKVTWTPKGAIAETSNGRDLRRDTFDAAGRILESRFSRPPLKGDLVLGYARSASGQLVSTTRTTSAGGARATDPSKRDKTIVADDLSRLPTGIERHEVLLLFGAPAKHSDTGTGLARVVADDYADGCWMNAPSRLEYDPTALFARAQVTCICGFCVDPKLAPHAPDRVGVDEHWTRGPWVRLDGWIDVTADHEILTPSGPRACGTLSAGDLVLDEHGQPRLLLAFERIPSLGERLGVNLRTASKTFFAGGLSFVSEEPRNCP